jgi:hypothetical protein
VTETGKASVGEEHSPAGRKIWVPRLAPSRAPEDIHESDYRGGHQRHSEERMSESAVMVQGERGASEAAENIEVGSFGGQSQRGSGEGRLPVEPSAAHGGAE